MSGKGLMRLRFVPYFLLFCVLLCSCSLHDHEWQDPTCTTAKTCTVCGDTDGDPLGHQWADATCTAPKTCTVCGETAGSPSKHNWAKATCEAPKTCSICGAQEGEALGHSFNPATWRTTVKPTCQAGGESSNTCLRCNATTAQPVPSVSCSPGSWQTVEESSTSTLLVKARYCTMCGAELDRKEVTLPALHQPPRRIVPLVLVRATLLVAVLPLAGIAKLLAESSVPRPSRNRECGQKFAQRFRRRRDLFKIGHAPFAPFWTGLSPVLRPLRSKDC